MKTFILIMYWYGVTQGTSGKTALAVEYNSRETCIQAYHALYQKHNKPDLMLCTEK